MNDYDRKQTAKLARCAEHIRSIAVQAAQALRLNGDFDSQVELLEDIKRDVEMAIKLNNELARNNVD